MKPPTKIRWSKDDIQEFARIRKNYNAKIERIKKSKPELIDFLPDKLDKKVIYSRKDLNVVKRYADMFLKKGANEFVPVIKKDKENPFPSLVPKFFKEQLQRIVKSENAKRKIQAAKLTPERGTTSLKAKGDIHPLKVAPKGKPTKDTKKKQVELSEYKKALEKMHLLDSTYIKNATLYRENYIIELNKKIIGTVPQPAASMLCKPIEELLRSMPVGVIFTAYQEYSYALYLKFIYDIQDAAAETKALYNTWCAFLGYTPDPEVTAMYDSIIDGQDYTKQQQQTG